MTRISESLDDLRKRAQQLVTAVAGGVEANDLHTLALELLLKIVEVQSDQANDQTRDTATREAEEKDDDSAVREEIAKVARKLPKWAHNQLQINSRILTLYLKLYREGINVITEDQLCERYGDVSEFHRNYPQMKSISPKNHAKIFNSVNGVVEIWGPVKQYVDEYERVVFDEIKR
ncbi:MAG: hypothetical protein GY777_26600 [Candidatus Brocadiaceae bacterium]|nr:hypothetical protein [Candidatus Brocadiaceae bacterium]